MDFPSHFQKLQRAVWQRAVPLDPTEHFACIFLLWQTTSKDQAYNELLILSAILVAAFGILASVGYFGLSEINRRVERIKRYLRAFP